MNVEFGSVGEKVSGPRIDLSSEALLTDAALYLERIVEMHEEAAGGS